MSLIISGKEYKNEKPYYWNGTYLYCGTEKFMLSKDGSKDHCGSAVIATSNQGTRNHTLKLEPDSRDTKFTLALNDSEKYTGYYPLKIDFQRPPKAVYYWTHSRNWLTGTHYYEKKATNWGTGSTTLYNQTPSSSITVNTNMDWADFPDPNWWGSEDIWHLYSIPANTAAASYLGLVTFSEDASVLGTYTFGNLPWLTVTYKGQTINYFSVHPLQDTKTNTLDKVSLSLENKDYLWTVVPDMYYKSDTKTIKV